MDFHYIITLVKSVHGDACSATVKGVFRAGDGQTRGDLVSSVYEYVTSKTGLQGANIMYFDLAPNELPAVVQAICY